MITVLSDAARGCGCGHGMTQDRDRLVVVCQVFARCSGADDMPAVPGDLEDHEGDGVPGLFAAGGRSH